MPENDDFLFKILIDRIPVSEYIKDGKSYIESDLNTPVSYMQDSIEFANGEMEQQAVPVTPYTIYLEAKQGFGRPSPSYYRIIVDGIKVKALSLVPGEERVIKGFKDGSAIREFLFSMPRFAQDQGDRLEQERLQAVGSIKVECWHARLVRHKSGHLVIRDESLDFKQANKKDTSAVTRGNYTLVTSKAGRAVSRRNTFRTIDKWHLEYLKSSLCVHYRMKHTLQEMELLPSPTSRRRVETSPETQNSTLSSVMHSSPAVTNSMVVQTNSESNNSSFSSQEITNRDRDIINLMAGPSNAFLWQTGENESKTETVLPENLLAILSNGNQSKFDPDSESDTEKPSILNTSHMRNCENEFETGIAAPQSCLPESFGQVDNKVSNLGVPDFSSETEIFTSIMGGQIIGTNSVSNQNAHVNSVVPDFVTETKVFMSVAHGETTGMNSEEIQFLGTTEKKVDLSSTPIKTAITTKSESDISNNEVQCLGTNEKKIDLIDLTDDTI